MHNIFKKLLFVVLLTLSPLVIVVILGAIYIIIQIVNGMEMAAGFSSFIAILHSLMPYFPYLTTIPVVLIIVILLLRKCKTVGFF